MLKIAICESNAVSAAKATAYFARYKTHRNANLTVSLYEDDATFLEGAKNGVDVAFLSLTMPDLNGLETAHALHELEPDAAIVFVTDLSQLVLKGFGSIVTDVMPKPVSYSALATMMDRLAKREEKRSPAIFLNGKETVRAEINDIYYLESSRSNVIYHTKNGDVQIQSSLSEEKQRLPEIVFARCNGKTVVNLGYVTKVMGNNVFAGGATHSLAGRYKAEFMQKLLAFMDRR